MNADEIVKKLMEIAEKLDRLDDSISGDVVANAADLIESLQAENERLAIHGGRYMQLADERYKMFERAIKRAEDAEAQLTASQRMAQDARNELCLKCGRYCDAHKGACDGCRWKA